MTTTLNLDDAKAIDIIVHRKQICSVSFSLSVDAEWSVNAIIKVGRSYDDLPIKQYTIGNGITINGQVLTWQFNPNEWGNRAVVYDAMVIRTLNQQRDWFGKITINQSFN